MHLVKERSWVGEYCLSMVGVYITLINKFEKLALKKEFPKKYFLFF